MHYLLSRDALVKRKIVLMYMVQTKLRGAPLFWLSLLVDTFRVLCMSSYYRIIESRHSRSIKNQEENKKTWGPPKNRKTH